ncbi:MAG: hypothetical protein KC925_03545 [Candidatus Doudnabacteria bacterium]|nr:hypothetical protein [Candidatus Doudnabacteria bacterium]
MENSEQGSDASSKGQRVGRRTFVKLIVLFLFIGVLGGGLFAWQTLGHQLLHEEEAVFLDNGQVYFGTVVRSSYRELHLTNVHYLQTSPLIETSEDAPDTELNLVKLGSELHGPEDRMVINRDHVLFTEELQPSSVVVQAMRRTH